MRFTEEQLMLQKTAREFAENEVAPRIDEIIKNEGFMPRDLYKRMGTLGFIGIMVPEEYGGSGLGMTEMIIVTEELCKIAPTLGLALMCVAPGLVPLSELPVFRERYLADVISGDKVFDGAVTDPSGHTNQPEWPVMAKKVDGGYVVNGTKLYVSYAAGVDVHEVYALDENREMKILVIEGDQKGFNHDAPEVKFGMKGSGGGTCTYHDVFVPDDLIIPTTVGAGEGYNWIWLQCATIAQGAMEGALAQATAYAKARTHDFKPIAQMQAQAERIALYHAKAMTTRALIYDACDAYANGDTEDAFLKSQVAKAIVPTVAYDVVKECVKLHGGLGYSDVHIYHYFTDVVSTAIMDLTTEYVLETIAGSIGLPGDLY